MTEQEFVLLVNNTFERSEYATTRYPETDLDRLVEFFGETLPPLFVVMRQLLRTHAILGDHLPADEMIHDYKFELENNPNFAADHIPFYAIGNGDYLCLSRSAGIASPVIYVAHDNPNSDILHTSFSDYLSDNSWFLQQ